MRVDRPDQLSDLFNIENDPLPAIVVLAYFKRLPLFEVNDQRNTRSGGLVRPVLCDFVDRSRSERAENTKPPETSTVKA